MEHMAEVLSRDRGNSWGFLTPTNKSAGADPPNYFRNDVFFQQSFKGHQIAFDQLRKSVVYHNFLFWPCIRASHCYYKLSFLFSFNV